MTDTRAEIREFLSSRRARVTPEQAGLPAYGGNRLAHRQMASGCAAHADLVGAPRHPF